jgi:propanol-preferring alcohol dehydrogenase
MDRSMLAWSFDRPAPAGERRLWLSPRSVPTPDSDEVLVRVLTCGLCRTDLHLVEGDLAPRRTGVVPGHQVVGEVLETGTAATRFAPGDRIGIAWLRRTCGHCRWCRQGRENLCPASQYTGWDADGGLAEVTTAPQAYAYRLPDAFDDLTAAPLLCAGIIGYRALRRAALPPGGRLGIYGFGSSAHLTAQIALAQGAEVFVMTRGEANRDLARRLGAHFVGAAAEVPPAPLDAAILFAPAGGLVPAALDALDSGGRLAVAGIHLTDIPELTYQRHLFRERELCTVTSNTRRDGEELLRIAARLNLRVQATEVPFEGVADALADLAAGRIAGSAVVRGPR